MRLALVLFLDNPLPAPEEAVRRMVRDALGVEPKPDTTPDHGSETGSETGDVTATVTNTGERPGQFCARFTVADEEFRVTVSNQPWPEATELVARIEPPDTRERFRRHAAFLAVEQHPPTATPEFESTYHPIARVLAEACAADAVAVFAPQWDRIQAVTVATADQLRGPQPLLSLGILHTRLGCLLREDSMWVSVFPTRWGPVPIAASGGAAGPSREHTDRMREIAEHKLRYLRAKLLFSLFYRPCQVLLDKHGEISVEYRNWFTGTRRHFVSADNVPI